MEAYLIEPTAPVSPAAIQPIPPSIVMAIAAVMSAMEAVKKSNKNTHGGYSYSSTDDIYAAITKKMGEIGLIILTLEESPPEINHLTKDGKPSNWMKVSYLFVLATKDATWTDARFRRTLYIQILAPQTFQAAESYAKKQFLRSLFQIPTGDMDLDSLPEGFEFNALQWNAPKAPPPAPAGTEESLKSDEATVKEMTAQKPPPDMREVLKNVETAMGLAQDTKALNTIVDAFNKKYDGYIDQQVGANLDVLYDASVARLTKKK
jgi:hypothetical protein